MLLFASLLTNRLRDYNAEVLTATLVAIGIVLITSRRHVVAGWVAIVVGVVNTPAAIVGLAFVAVVEALRQRRLRPLLWRQSPPARSCSRPGSGEAARSRRDTAITASRRCCCTPVVQASATRCSSGCFRSCSRSVEGSSSSRPDCCSGWEGGRAGSCETSVIIVLMLVFVVGLILAYAKWWAWYGGLSWGPRFFVFAAVPASALLVIRLRHPGESSAAAILLVVGVLDALRVGRRERRRHRPLGLGFCAQDDYALESLCWYTPEYSPLWRPLVDFPDLSASTAVVAAYCVLVCVPRRAALRRARRVADRAAGEPAQRAGACELAMSP